MENQEQNKKQTQTKTKQPGNDVAMLHKRNFYTAEDFDVTFAGNTDEHFRIGLSVSKKSIRLYSPFYMADIIIASPLGLRTIIGAPGWDVSMACVVCTLLPQVPEKDEWESWTGMCQSLIFTF